MPPTRALLALVAGLALLRLAGCHQGAGRHDLGGTAQMPDLAGEPGEGAPPEQPPPLPGGQPATGRLDEGELVCEDVTKLDAGDDFCTFVRNHCKAESLVNWPQLYYCHVAPHGALLTAVMLLGCTVLLGLLFRIIARAADDFFSCILSQISQDLGLPPRLGGVTLLALGNGAPDLSASIAAVKTGNYQLAMGALTGAGMFVGGVVAGRIITLSGGVRARGAQLRDISTQFITVAVVTGIVASGWFTYGGVATLLSIYAGYVVVVAVADFTKRAGVEWGEVARKVSRRMSGRWRVEMVAPLLQEDHGAAAATGHGAPPPGRLAAATRQQQQQQETILEEGPAVEGEALGAAGTRLLPSPELDLAAEAAGSLPSGRLSPLSDAPAPAPGSMPQLAAALSAPAAAGARTRFASLPDLQTTAARRQQQASYWHAQQQHQQHQQQLAAHYPHPHHPHRLAPPVARFQPRVAYSDLVQMPAKEYRRRALAEMAQSTSFYVRDQRDVDEGPPEAASQQQRQQRQGEVWEKCSDSESSDEEEEEERSWEGSPGGRRRSTAAEWDAGGAYQPPVVGFNAAMLGARPRSTGDIAAAAAAAVAEVAECGGLGAAGPGLAPQPHHHLLPQAERPGSAASRPSASSTPHSSFEMAMTTADAAAAAVAQVDAEARAAGGAAGGCGLAADEWETEVPPGRVRRVLEAVQWPVLLLLQTTIPLVEVNSYQRSWFLRSMAASPLFICAYLRLFHWYALLAAAGVGASLAAAAHLGTQRLQGKAPVWTCGTSYPIGAALVAVYGFAVAAMWISLFASEIVGLLQFFGMLSKLDPAVLGVTLLAWGNSLMDYMNNTAMAGRSRGGNSMAMTACFAGPLFNMLVGLGLGFWALLGESGAAATQVEMDPVVLVGCVFILVNCACLVGISLAHRQYLPAWCGWGMVGLYCLYLTVVLAVMTLT